MVRITWVCITFLLTLFLLAPQGCAAPQMFLEDGSRPVPAMIPVESVHRIFTVPSGAACSAVAIGPDVLMTAKHCTEVDTHFTSEFPFEAHEGIELLDQSQTADLATLQNATGLFGAVAETQLHTPPAGMEMYLVGYGCSGVLEVRAAQYVGSGVLNDGNRYMTLFGHACYGDSGGGVFTASGVLVGIMTHKAPDGTVPDYLRAASLGEF